MLLPQMIEVGIGVGAEIGGHLANGIKVLGELPCLGIFAKVPNAAKHTQCSQVTPNNVSSS